MLDQPSLQALLDQVDDALVVLEPPIRPRRIPRVLHVNRAYEGLTGVPADQIIGRSLALLRAPGFDRGSWERLLALVASDGAGLLPFAIATDTGVDLAVQLRVQPFLAGERRLVAIWVLPLAVPRDPLERLDDLKLAGATAGDCSYLLRVTDTLEIIPDWLDPRIEQISGFSAREVAAMRGGLTAIAAPDDVELLVTRNQRLFSGEICEVEYRLVHRDGSQRKVRDRARPLRDGNVTRHIFGSLRALEHEPGADAIIAAVAPAVAGLSALLRRDAAIVDARGSIRWTSDAPEGTVGEFFKRAAENVELLHASDFPDEWFELVDEAFLRRAPASIRFRVPMANEALQLQAFAISDRFALVASSETSPPSRTVVASAEQLAEPLLDLLDIPVLLIADDQRIVVANQVARRRWAGLADRGCAVALPDLFDDPTTRANLISAHRQLLEQTAMTGAVEIALAGDVGATGQRLALRRLPPVLRVHDADTLVKIIGGDPRRGLDEATTHRAPSASPPMHHQTAVGAPHDPLTGLHDRASFHARLARALPEASLERSIAALMLVDLDRFKRVNVSLGLEQGDVVLREAALRIARAADTHEDVGRLSGDTFALLLRRIESAEDAAAVASSLIADLAKPIVGRKVEVSVNASIGIAVFPYDGHEAGALLRSADAALAKAKEAGPNVLRFYTPDLDARAFERMRLETELRRAVERSELVLNFQPQMDLARNELLGAEALLRWTSAALGRVPPQEFIPLAEDTGLIVPIGRQVLADACRDTARLRRELGLVDFRMSVNLSARQFDDPQLVDAIDVALRENALGADSLVVEITESTLMVRGESARRRLDELHEMGIRIAIDDFGTGYSSLAYLRDFPLDSLKIDGAFVRRLGANGKDSMIVQTIIQLGRGLGLSTIAEGVETFEQARLLRALGCHQIQGYCIARPMPLADVIRMFSDWQPPPELAT